MRGNKAGDKRKYDGDYHQSHKLPPHELEEAAYAQHRVENSVCGEVDYAGEHHADNARKQTYHKGFRVEYARNVAFSRAYTS